jgi:ribosomal protein L39E
MSSNHPLSSQERYRLHAENCLRMAKGAQDERDVPLWVTLAQSWLRLAEHSDRLRTELQYAADARAEGDDVVRTPT